ncbi:MAG: hypothetical protein HY704_05800 [Gemmatimonadetes bacterium]|nr:hypothetical protein [Gemmatimonadota bacterium]
MLSRTEERGRATGGEPAPQTLPRRAPPRARHRRGRWPALLAVGFAPALLGCDNLLEVNNPNKLTDESVRNPAAAAALANGALATVSRAAAQVLTIHSVAADELTRIGTKDGYDPIDFGNLSDPTNEFTDPAFTFVAEARWTADEAVRILESFDSAGTLRNRSDLARAYLYGAIAYTLVGDFFEDFVFSDRTKPQPPIGDANMHEVYDRAIGYLDRGLGLAREAANAELEQRILAVRARIKHGKSVWAMLQAGRTPEKALVDDPGAVEDARAFLGFVGLTSDWRFRFTYSLETVSSDLAFQVNERNELMWQKDYIEDPANRSKWQQLTLRDPIAGVPDPVLKREIASFMAQRQFAPVTVVSARELHLILAEAALARGDEGEAGLHINHVRALDGLTPFRGQLPALAVLEHERRVNLFLQGRRLADHYRFGRPSSRWQANSEAVRRPGTVFPITDRERRTNCYLLGRC